MGHHACCQSGHCQCHSHQCCTCVRQEEGAACHEESCTHHHHHCHDHCHCHEQHFSQELLAMADQAWMEVLKEKVKEQIRTSSGRHLDKLAKLVAESNKVRWKQKLETYKISRDYKDKVTEFFNSRE